jgi:hypothetical protein
MKIARASTAHMIIALAVTRAFSLDEAQSAQLMNNPDR